MQAIDCFIRHDLLTSEEVPPPCSPSRSSRLQQRPNRLSARRQSSPFDDRGSSPSRPSRLSNSLWSLPSTPTNDPERPLRRSSSVELDRSPSWSEFPARWALVKLRNRRSAKRTRRLQRRRAVTHPPSKAVHELLQVEYAKCRSSESGWSERLLALVYCWYFGWIQDIYVNLADGRRDWLKWTVACLLVTCVTVLCLGLIALCARLLVIALAGLLHAVVNFILFVSIATVIVVAFLTVFSYGRDEPSTVGRFSFA
ncbi:hypothetical protein CAPTEDRAFT_188534 [Capitella teleta]|uniref:Transmembrane protein n=1 Tax=Capitella teleta TaxID=283909 RepID=R7U0B2_CAPTE|nr:hypothetical protein CAPTEDRAFT_188534 [Capitella teleta]|eukprot:ELT99419.1 hypothetical protein CAPTEDRAFT_188534 [Capitella teleta]